MSKSARAMPHDQAPPHVIAGALGLTGFTIAIIAGMSVGNDASAVLTTAMLCMFGCYIVGLLVGHMAHRVLQAHVEEYRASHPVAGHVAKPAPGAQSTSASELSTDAKKM